MTKEEFLKNMMNDIDAAELKGEDIMWIGGQLVGDGFSRMVDEKFRVKKENN